MIGDGIHGYHRVTAFGEDCVYAWRNPGGGTHFPLDEEEGYDEVRDALSLKYLRENRPSWRDGPEFSADRDVGSLLEDAAGMLTRAEAAAVIERVLAGLPDARSR